MKKSKRELKVIRQKTAIKPRMNLIFKPLKSLLLPENEESWWVSPQKINKMMWLQQCSDPQMQQFPSKPGKHLRRNQGTQGRSLVLPGCSWTTDPTSPQELNSHSSPKAPQSLGKSCRKDHEMASWRCTKSFHYFTRSAIWRQMLLDCKSQYVFKGLKKKKKKEAVTRRDILHIP